MDDSLYFRAIISLLFVLGLIGLLSLIIRKLGLGHNVSNKNEGSRLNIKEVRHVDQKRKLLLIKRDDTEHLLLLSSTGDIVIESNIQSNVKHD